MLQRRGVLASERYNEKSLDLGFFEENFGGDEV